MQQLLVLRREGSQLPPMSCCCSDKGSLSRALTDGLCVQMGAKPVHLGSCLPRRARGGRPRLAGAQALPPSQMALMAHELQVNRPM